MLWASGVCKLSPFFWISQSPVENFLVPAKDDKDSECFLVLGRGVRSLTLYFSPRNGFRRDSIFSSPPHSSSPPLYVSPLLCCSILIFSLAEFFLLPVWPLFRNPSRLHRPRLAASTVPCSRDMRHLPPHVHTPSSRIICSMHDYGAPPPYGYLLAPSFFSAGSNLASDAFLCISYVTVVFICLYRAPKVAFLLFTCDSLVQLCEPLLSCFRVFLRFSGLFSSFLCSFWSLS